MNVISSSLTFYFSRVFPTVWFGVLGCFAVGLIVTGELTKNYFVLLHLVFMFGLGFVIMKKLVWGVVDKVEDHGQHLKISKSGVEIDVKITDIDNVSVTTLQNPPRVTIRVNVITPLGQDITFFAKMGSVFNPFAKCTVADDLLDRVIELRKMRLTNR